MSDYIETFTQANGDTSDASALEAEFDAISTAVNSKLDADGSGTLTGNLNMGNNLITALGTPTTPGGAVPLGILGVKQVVIGTLTSDFSTSSAVPSYVSTGLTATITPVASDSNLLIFVSAFVGVEYDTGGAVIDRYANWDIYLSTGVTGRVMVSSVGRNLVSASSEQGFSYSPMTLMGTATPGAGTHTYQLRCAVPNGVLDAHTYGATGSQAVMAIAECKP